MEIWIIHATLWYMTWLQLQEDQVMSRERYKMVFTALTQRVNSL